jgi:hypothetical protein
MTMKVQIIPGHLQNALGQQRPIADLSRAEQALCLDILARIIHSNDQVDILRPDEHPFTLADINAFRAAQYQTLSPYLLDSHQQAIETRCQLDERSQQFVAVTTTDALTISPDTSSKPDIIGCARVTPAPFELSQLTPELAEAASHYPDYWELSRLVVDAQYSSGFVGEKLFMGAARWLCLTTDIPGFLLICKTRRKRYFEYYGLKAHPGADGQPQSFVIPCRNSQTYYLMTGTFPAFIDCIFSTLYQKPDEMEKRHRWTEHRA